MSRYNSILEAEFIKLHLKDNNLNMYFSFIIKK